MPRSSSKYTIRIGKIAQAAICLSFLFLVIVFHVMGLSGTDGNTSQYKRIAKAPDSGLIFRSFSEWARQSETYYCDSSRLLDSFTHWDRLLKLCTFGDSPVSQVKVGREGWLFYTGERALDDYMNVIPFKSEDLEKMGRVLEERRAWLEAKGIKFLILVAPNKATVYSEYLPGFIHKIGEKSRLDQVKTYLEARYPKLEFVDVREALSRAKRTQPLYYKTDTHWNGYGAFIAYGELMERIGSDFPTVKKHTLDHFTVNIQEYKNGYEAFVLSQSDYFADEQITLAPKFAPRARDLSPPSAHGSGDTIIREVDDPHLLKAVVFHDSFSQHLIPYLSEDFRRIVFVWKFDFNAELIESEKPDIVILECVERYIHMLSLENPPEVRAALHVSQ